MDVIRSVGFAVIEYIKITRMVQFARAVFVKFYDYLNAEGRDIFPIEID